jgi:hypothetical protein
MIKWGFELSFHALLGLKGILYHNVKDLSQETTKWRRNSIQFTINQSILCKLQEILDFERTIKLKIGDELKSTIWYIDLS